MDEFKREERYIVVKLKDVDGHREQQLRAYLRTRAIPTRECVVAEPHHPHYEETWENVQRWAEGRPTIGQERGARIDTLEKEPRYHQQELDSLLDRLRKTRDERDALAADAIRFRHLVETDAFRILQPDMGGNHTWFGVGRPIGKGATIAAAIDAEIARRIDEGTYNG